MKLIPSMLNDLSTGQTVYIARSFSMPETYVYIGVLKEYYCFINDSAGPSLKIYTGNPLSNHDLNTGNIFTTYGEYCIRMRELSLNTIDHFNKHQLKGNPIIVLAK